jgi:hypothetical protein
MRYALRDRGRGLEDVSVWRVSAEGTLRKLGTLIAATPGPDALAFVQSDGVATWFDGLPWWLNDMRPQGYLGRAWAARHGRALGLPDDCRLWSGTHTLRALLAHGHDGTGNLLLGDYAREQFLSMPEPEPVVPAEFPALASAAAEGSGGSSAGGEQPKFVAYTGDPPRHSIIKFSATGNDPVVSRWRNLLVAEHLALETLRDFRVPAAATHVVDVKEQRFLVSERFDRRGTRGRVALLSLESLDAEFVGRGSGPWPGLASALAEGNGMDSSSPTASCCAKVEIQTTTS